MYVSNWLIRGNGTFHIYVLATLINWCDSCLKIFQCRLNLSNSITVGWMV